MSIKYENFNLKKFWGNFIIYSNSAGQFSQKYYHFVKRKRNGLIL